MNQLLVNHWEKFYSSQSSSVINNYVRFCAFTRRLVNPQESQVSIVGKAMQLLSNGVGGTNSFPFLKHYLLKLFKVINSRRQPLKRLLFRCSLYTNQRI